MNKPNISIKPGKLFINGAGTVWLNTWHYYSPNAPFGGYKQSGYGREQGIEAFDDYFEKNKSAFNLPAPVKK